jgi:hypothetical protein
MIIDPFETFQISVRRKEAAKHPRPPTPQTAPILSCPTLDSRPIVRRFCAGPPRSLRGSVQTRPAFQWAGSPSVHAPLLL